MDKLFWHGGRLEGVLDNSTVSLSIDEVWPLTEKDARIAKACEYQNPKNRGLRPYNKHNVYLIAVLLNKERQREKV